MRVYTQFEPPPKPVVGCTEDMTRQSEAAALDVNKIVARFAVTGLLPQRTDGVYLDVSQVTDYREALEQVRAADSVFMKLDAKVRAHFQNDPALFLDAIVDPARKDELIEVGVFKKEPPKAGEPVVPVVPPS